MLHALPVPGGAESAGLAHGLRLRREECLQPHQEAEVSFHLVLACHEGLLTILLLAGDCHPDLGRGLDGDGRCRGLPRGRGAGPIRG